MASHKESSLSRQAYEQIRNNILNGVYRLGSPLSRRRLAEELGMSLIPVAEAMQQLEREGLLESRPRVGTRVKIPTPGEIRGTYYVREALESQAARLFAETATPEQHRELHALAAEVDRKAEAAQRRKTGREAALFAFERLHTRLHMRLAECTGCKELTEAIERSRVLIFNWLFAVTAKLEPLPPRWHRDLMDALATGDPLKADEAMRRHVRFRRDDVLRQFDELLADGSGRQQILRGPQRRTLARKKAGAAPEGA